MKKKRRSKTKASKKKAGARQKKSTAVREKKIKYNKTINKSKVKPSRLPTF